MVPCWRSRVFGEATWLIRDWNCYTSVRGLSKNSPIPMLMHFPLSVYFSLLMKAGIANDPVFKSRGSIEICYLGPQAEMRVLPVFVELGCLLAGYDLDVHFIGPDVEKERPSIRWTNPTSERCPKERCACRRASSVPGTPSVIERLDEDGSLELPRVECPEASNEGHPTETRLHFHRGVYHECLIDRRPDLVFCANAGVELYDSWGPSLERMAMEGTFSVLTDYTEEAVHRSKQFCRSLGIVPSFSFVNPFRCPVQREAVGIRVPAFSNGFGFVLNGRSQERAIEGSIQSS